jgi:DNA-binding GntR family transcriptional regulator
VTSLHIGDHRLTSSISEKLSAAEDAYYRIREMVVTATLRPGQIISENELVGHLGIGRTPIREAIQRLANQHVVEIFPRRGVAVAKLGLDDVQAIFEARETIEEKTAELAAMRRTDDEAQALAELGKRINSIAQDENFTVFLDMDQRLHHLIASAARNWLLAESADHLLMLTDWIWHQYFQMRSMNRADYFTHEPIIQAIVARDAECAGAAMREHVQQSREVIRSAM